MQNSHSIRPIIIIPARLAARRLPNKPLAMIGDKPMIIHCLECAQQTDIAEVLVAAGDREIADCVQDYGGQAVMTAADLSSGSDRIEAAIRVFDPSGKFNYVINFQGDLPFFDSSGFQHLLNGVDDTHTSVRTLAAVITDPQQINAAHVVKVQAGFARYNVGACSRAIAFSRQAVPWGEGPYLHHIGIYGYPRSVLHEFVRLPSGVLEQREKLEQLRLLENGYAIKVVLVDSVPMSVDVASDLEAARNWVR